MVVCKLTKNTGMCPLVQWSNNQTDISLQINQTILIPVALFICTLWLLWGEVFMAKRNHMEIEFYMENIRKWTHECGMQSATWCYSDRNADWKFSSEIPKDAWYFEQNCHAVSIYQFLLSFHMIQNTSEHVITIFMWIWGKFVQFFIRTYSKYFPWTVFCQQIDCSYFHSIFTNAQNENQFDINALVFEESPHFFLAIVNSFSYNETLLKIDENRLLSCRYAYMRETRETMCLVSTFWIRFSVTLAM